MSHAPLPIPSASNQASDDDYKTQQPRLWRDDGWTARVIKNEDDEGWAVEMIRDGETESALTGPWTMGRDKKNPKPLDANAFHTLVKTASEVLRRHEQGLQALLHRSIRITAPSGSLDVKLDIVADEENPYALLSAYDAADQQQAQVRVAASFRLNRQSATAWVESGYQLPLLRHGQRPGAESFLPEYAEKLPIFTGSICLSKNTG